MLGFFGKKMTGVGAVETAQVELNEIEAHHQSIFNTRKKNREDKMRKLNLNEHQGSLDMSAYDFIAVTKDDNEDLPEGICRGLLVGVEGTLNLTTPEGRAVNDVPVVRGYNPLFVARVRAGGTADNIFALY